jgi:hypothetical protein
VSDQGLHITGGGTTINHLHGNLVLARGGRQAAGADLPTAYMLDVRELLRVSAETGLTIVPWRDGEARAYVFLASRPMRDWVAAQIGTGQPLWLPATAQPAVGAPALAVPDSESEGADGA